MTTSSLDPRLTPARADLAAAFLKGRVTAKRFCEGTRYQLIDGLTNLYGAPDANTPLQTQLLYGEYFTVYDIKDGWAWGQAEKDSYVGYCRADALSPDLHPGTHYVTNLSSHIYSEPNPKSPAVGQVYMMSNVAVINEIPQRGFVQLADGNWIFAPHISKDYGVDPLSEALKFLYAPYLWGGKSSIGIDCSGLIQLAFAATGVFLPRDSDLQAEMIGTTLDDDAVPQRGDIAFFPGHVGFMLDDMHLLHANAHHMRVSIDPLRDVIDIVSFQTDEPPLRFIKRPAED
ncbi:NlpC/P60 family protein [Paremcibacter congregatus]|uniref:Peptidase P60 n=1 Tax=Paremcibacter congregatus TaxID=2043170 RepID=A0A2G4YWL4_9PROT|nr:NlpC/P60 family protein [Paremcibacter congregatus]PHZ86653.1 peptidase P60 [Paremcibacter congregatus]QDE26454.1 NlpC/P60 family protein [Paremcibacter congregatus]